MSERAHILIADDEPNFRQAVARLLEREGYVVEHASGALEALALLANATFDLLIADVHMPGNDGLAVVREQDRVPVLVITGEPSVESAVSALRGSAVDYLAKPFAPDHFLSRVADGVARGRTMRRIRSTESHLREQLEALVDLRIGLHVAGIAPQVHERSPTATPVSEANEGVLPESIAASLSARECEVLSVFASNPRITDVAHILHLSQHTVKNHFRSIYRKLEVSSQAELLTRLGQAQRDDHRK